MNMGLRVPQRLTLQRNCETLWVDFVMMLISIILDDVFVNLLGDFQVRIVFPDMYGLY